ncbi:hypothetical protein EG850_12280 [Gulosibacter macacae]|uniref:DUF3846 domain-containing protein n=1 Tax=Gulosibacter macacae TaxID=2488791 RepID=A0A3P3VYE2_9MICO|nr:hypothetical protein [Gulosibacter macacae]RRJ85693.1 hypothetical protein EG850_12280 [Gulosibacter macacae]
MPKGIVIRADMKAPPEFGDFDNLADLEAIAGSPVKVVPISTLGVVAVASAEGNRRGLPVNTYATLLWWFWVPALRRKVVLLGDVVIVGEPDPDGQPTNIPASFAGNVLSQHGHSVKLKVTGEKGWYRTDTVANNYFDAIVFAFDLLDNWPEAEAARIVPRAPHEA